MRKRLGALKVLFAGSLSFPRRIYFVDVALNFVKVVEYVNGAFAWAEVVGLSCDVVDSPGEGPVLVIAMRGVSNKLVVSLEDDVLQISDARVVGNRADEAKAIISVDR